MNRDRLAARLLATFVAELEEQVGVMNADLMALEAQPTSSEHLQSLFRIAHTLKGAARAASVPEVEAVCHAMESLLSLARNGKFVLGPDQFSLLFSTADELSAAVVRLRAGESLQELKLEELRRALDESQPAAAEPGTRAPASSAPRPAPPPAPPERAPTPPPAPAPAPPPAATPTAAPSGPGPGGEQIRVEIGKLDALLSSAGELRVASGRLGIRSTELQQLRDGAEMLGAEWRRLGRQVRRELRRAEAPPALLERLEAAEQRLEGVFQETARLAGKARQDARIFSRLSNDLGGGVHQLRMRPFMDACAALPRVVRDLATSAGKEVSLEISGGEVEADRAVLDGLREAILHLVRNAIDHGIEPPEQRERAGKPRSGRVSVSATLRGRRLVVTVADDGTGLNLPAIRARLEQMDRPVPDDERELGQALFEPGFSTRTEVTDISGRGVGLDLVRNAVEKIRGSVQVEWKAGQGTALTIECPPTLTTIRALLVSLGSCIVAVPTAHVERLLRIQPQEVQRAEGRDVLLTSQAPVPIASLAGLLGPPLEPQAIAGPTPVIRLLVGGRRLAVTVEELLTEQEIVVRPLKRIRPRLPYLSGAAVLGSGQIALVLNTPALVATGLARDTASLPHAPRTPAGPAKRRVLVVDDSLTTRALEQSILEAAGYEVVTAVDGAEAWRLLQEQPFALVVSDVEMPRMTGLQLCERIRGSRQLEELPIILVTALQSPEERARGLEVGADAYIVKSSFDQQDLLDTIEQLLG